ncbi:putative phage abortive infection protein [Pseudoalteromonas sp. 2CM39R]|uniref:putative phage abortive infection protein n=1 Tax=Pseudoalteromonas sp. 2CM39R TaxID=2929856 RepID=UPI0020BF756F|nr:putative phage abortive infection protein [Pseudoalteromonas sp. 2CM39R]MCK8124659.1 putative phage abortive infection protein [Pseudoalteromonas sp. 2CM39R]
MKRMILLIFCLAVVIGITAILFYVDNFGFGYAQTIGDWGAVGDFFGGVLNPTFALLSLILIAYTLMQNKKALEQSEKALQVSNQELALTRNELANSATALEEQAKLLAVQSFETTFFNMLELHSRLLDNFSYDYSGSYVRIKEELNIDHYSAGSSKDAKPGIFYINRLLTSISDAHKNVKSSQSNGEKSIINTFNVFYRYENKEFGIYFRNLYQVLKLIKDSVQNVQEQKKYSNILRAQLSNQELLLLFLNCLCPKVDKGQFRELVIHFELLEHLDITYVRGKDELRSIFRVNNPTFFLETIEVDEYISFNCNGEVNKSAFGRNNQISSYCENEKATNCKEEDINLERNN